MTAVYALLLSVSAFVASGDRAFHSMAYQEAIAHYDSALMAEPDLPDALWRLARVYVAWGEVAPEHLRESLYRRGAEHARHCIRIDSTKAEGHTWLAASLGNISLFVGKKEKVLLAREIKRELDKALAFRQDDDATYSILGSFYRALGSVGWLQRQLSAVFVSPLPDGGFPESELAFRKAIELAPQIPRHRYELGMLYLDWDRKEKAYEHFRAALALPVTAAGDTVARNKMLEILKETTK
jgi:tetratricopeptide (TPR) repeat protein